ncbi:MAG: hypothetical protein R6X02_21690 [Enhygromyxa sp.]
MNIDEKYQELGGSQGFLGDALEPETDSADGEGRYRRYQNGDIYWHPSTDAHAVHGSIRTRYRAMGAETGALGYPLTDERSTPEGVGRYNHFQRGSIYWHPTTGAHEVLGRIRERWAMFGWERGFLGYPGSNQQVDTSGFARTRFVGGWIGFDPATDTVRVVRCPSADSPTYMVPIHALRLSNDDGTRTAAIDAAQIHQWIDRSNRVFEIAGVEFEFDGTIHDLHDSKINGVTGTRDPHWAHVKSTVDAIAAQERAMVIVFRHGPNAGATGGGFSWWDYDFVVMPGFNATWVAGKQNIGLMPHEIGHFMGLPHTFVSGFGTVADARNYLVNRNLDSASLDNDRHVIDDTPPEPMIGALATQWEVNAVELAGRAFMLGRDNVMSYYHPDANLGPRSLSPGQCERVRAMVVERRGRGSLDVTESWGDGAERQLYGASYTSYRQRYDELWSQGWRLYRLQPYVLANGWVRYTAIWRRSTAAEIQVYGWTYADYRAKYDELWPQGWRLHMIEPFVVGGSVRYTAVWRKSKAAEIQVYGWTYSAMRSKYDELWPQGWRLHLVKPYVIGGSVRYTAVWRKSKAAEIQVYGWTYSSFRQKYDELWPAGWRLQHLQPYFHGDRSRYTAVWRKKGGGEQQVYGWKAADMRSEYDELWSLNWRVQLIQPFVTSAGPRYSVVWRPESISWGSFACGASSSSTP